MEGRILRKTGIIIQNRLSKVRGTLNFPALPASDDRCGNQSYIQQWAFDYLFSSTDVIALRPIDFISPEVNLQLTTPGAQSHSDYPSEGSTQAILISWHKETTEVLEKFWTVWYRLPVGFSRKASESYSQGRYTALMPTVGHLVLIAEGNLPRGRWPLAIIVELHSDKDKTVISATIRTAKDKTIKLSINNLYPLEITASHIEGPPSRSPSTSSPHRVRPLKPSKVSNPSEILLLGRRCPNPVLLHWFLPESIKALKSWKVLCLVQISNSLVLSHTDWFNSSILVLLSHSYVQSICYSTWEHHSSHFASNLSHVHNALWSRCAQNRILAKSYDGQAVHLSRRYRSSLLIISAR